MNFWDFFFPKRCVQCKRIGDFVCADCLSFIVFNEYMVCAVCQKNTLDGKTHPRCRTRVTLDGIVSSVVFKGVVKKMVYQLKYPPYISHLRDIVVALFYEGIIQKELFISILHNQTIMIPIPIYHLRERQRGYNQAMLLAQGLSPLLQLPVIPALKRVKDTKTQVGLTKVERKVNIQDAFTIDDKYLSVIKATSQVFLVDDVATSGATLLEAASVLKKAGVKQVWGLTFAHGE